MIQLSLAIRNARLQAIVDSIPAASEVRLFAGTQPQTGGAEGLLLATLPLAFPAGTVNNSVLTFSPITNDTAADASDVVSWGRIVDGNGDPLIDFSCGTVASSAIMKFPTTNIVEGGVIRIASFVITEGNA